ncbi:MAG: triosephosphate isomerase [Patescibacteria group bacterium]|nr:triosephosphate isomerase [Patescibacteria group bacterium]
MRVFEWKYFSVLQYGHMKKLKKLVVGNWKMNPSSLAEAKKIAGDVKRGVKNTKKTQVVLCPPFVYLYPLSGVPRTSVLLGSQNVFYEEAGSYTGEVSVSQLSQCKTSFVIIGHSERRAMGETDDQINRKVRAVTHEGMTAIVCVGEKIHDQHGDYLAIVKKQIQDALRDVSKKLLDHVVVAYEPVWAIGAQDAMPAEDVHEMALFIKKVLRDMYGILADGIRIIYGGAVNTFNAQHIIDGGYVHGFLIGRESLKAKNFVEIIKIVDLS